MLLLALAYERGDGVDADLQQAARWLGKAMEAGASKSPEVLTAFKARHPEIPVSGLN
jgi:TPR repeat protein